jgi:hypothetical protein
MFIALTGTYFCQFFVSLQLKFMFPLTKHCLLQLRKDALVSHNFNLTAGESEFALTLFPVTGACPIIPHLQQEQVPHLHA